MLSYRDDSYTPTMLADATLRQTVAKNLVDFALAHNCDGLDIDIEGSGYAVNLGHFAAEVRSEIGSSALTLSSAVSGPVNEKFTDEFLAAMDWINPMVYDEAGTWSTSHFGDHAPMEEFTGSSGGANGWRTRIAKEKICLGVPFYGYTFPSTDGGMGNYKDYKEILAQWPNQTDADNIAGGLTWYNGPDEIKAKAQFVKDEGLGGIMIWDLNADVHDSRSLLTAINTVLQPSTGPYAITVTTTHGTVEVSPEQAEYDAGSEVILTAIADDGYLFAGWSGAAGDTLSEKSVTVNGDLSLTPIFAPIGNQIINGDFAAGAGPWTFSTGNSAAANAAVGNGSYGVAVSAAGVNTWDLQLRQSGLILVPGQVYTLQFTAWADAARSLAWNVGGSVNPWPSYSGRDSSVVVSTTHTVFTTSFVMDSALDIAARVEFNGGLTGGTWNVDDVSLRMGAPDVTSFAASRTEVLHGTDIAVRSGLLCASIEKPGIYTLAVYSLSGRLVSELFSGRLARGVHDITVDRSGMAAGAYLVRLSGEGLNRSSKLIQE